MLKARESSERGKIILVHKFCQVEVQLTSLPLCGMSVQEHFQIASHVTSTVLGARDSERRDRSSQSVGKTKMIRYFGGRKIMCRGLLGGWGVEINKA